MKILSWLCLLVSVVFGAIAIIDNWPWGFAIGIWLCVVSAIFDLIAYKVNK